jgi:hypothetical protein
VLLFVIRDMTKTPLDKLVEVLEADLNRMWEGLAKPPQYVDSTLQQFFEVGPACLPLPFRLPLCLPSPRRDSPSSPSRASPRLFTFSSPCQPVTFGVSLCLHILLLVPARLQL